MKYYTRVSNLKNDTVLNGFRTFFYFMKSEVLFYKVFNCVKTNFELSNYNGAV